MAAIFRAMPVATVQNLEGQGDITVMIHAPERADGRRLHVEVKRQNRLRTEWIAQAEREAPAGAVPVVAWRPDLSRWWAMIPLEDLARLLA